MKTPKARQWIEPCSRWTRRREVDAVRLGRLMREFREKHGRSLRKVASAIGKTAGYISDCERGFRKLGAEDLQKFINECVK